MNSHSNTGHLDLRGETLVLMRERKEEGTPQKALNRGRNSIITHSITGLEAWPMITTPHQPTL